MAMLDGILTAYLPFIPLNMAYYLLVVVGIFGVVIFYLAANNVFSGIAPDMKVDDPFKRIKFSLICLASWLGVVVICYGTN